MNYACVIVNSINGSSTRLKLRFMIVPRRREKGNTCVGVCSGYDSQPADQTPVMADGVGLRGRDGSPNSAHTHTHTHTYAHAHADTDTDTRTHTHTHTHTPSGGLSLWNVKSFVGMSENNGENAL